MESLLDYGIDSELELFGLVALTIFSTFIVVLLFSYSTWIKNKILAIGRLSPPKVKKITFEVFHLGDRKILKINWDVRGAENLIISDLSFETTLNPFVNNHQLTGLEKIRGSQGELLLEFEQRYNQPTLYFENIWGRTEAKVHKVPVNTSKKSVHSPSFGLAQLAQRAFLQEVQINLYKQHAASKSERIVSLKEQYKKYDLFEKESIKTSDKVFTSMRNDLIVSHNRLFKNILPSYSNQFEVFRNSPEVKNLRSELNRIQSSVK
jgi:hypothetical protein